LLVVASMGHAQTRYVTDRAIIELRRGPSTEYLILRNLESGTEVRVLEQDESNGYSRVSVGDQGVEGWILTRFLTSEPIARDRLSAAEGNLAAARQRVTALETEVKDLSTQLAATKTDLEQTRGTHAATSQELAEIRTAAANVVAIRDQNTSLRQQLTQRESEVEALTVANARLASRNNQNWFVVGAAVLLGGIVIGLIAPSLRRKRRSDW
jgi:SH3 domain protein